jgi:hypothetical protein
MLGPCDNWVRWLSAPGDVEGEGDQIEVELHVAVDELMGIRGPFMFLLRNIVWLIAFNGAYLGLFAFIPYRWDGA